MFKLDWLRRFFLGCLVLAAIGLLAGGGLLRWSLQSPDCTARIVQNQSAAAQYQQELEKASRVSRKAECTAYPAYVAALEKLEATAEMCGPAQATKRAAFPRYGAELAFQRRLMAERCA